MPGAVSGWELMAATTSEPSERQPDSWERALARSLEAWASFTLTKLLPDSGKSPFFSEPQFPHFRNLEADPRRHCGRTGGHLSQSP